MSIPLSIFRYIRSLLMSEMVITYLHINPDGQLAGWGGHPRHYGLDNLTTGKSAIEQIPFLEGFLPVHHTEILEFVAMERGRVAHIHLVPSAHGSWVLMFDATAEHDRQQQIQQQANELSLKNYQQSSLIQELEVAQHQLLGEKQQIANADTEKSRFIATLSHELRSPLNSIMGYADILENAKQADEEEREYLQNVKQSVDYLLNLIDSILNQSRLDAGKLNLNTTVCDIKGLASDLQKLYMPAATDKHLEFSITMQDASSVCILIDEVRFRQVLINLITNAIKFTETGFVKVTLSWQNQQLHFAVVDSGKGISEAAQQRIFTAFNRGENAEHQPGVGLGLSIANQLVQLMQGELRVASSAQGSTFSGFIHAPLVSHFGLDVINKTTPTDADPQTPRILLVEDTEVLCALMEFYLREGGYEVLIATDGEQALEMAKQQPDLVLLDMHLPCLNGDEVVKTLRQRQFGKPIIALSASNFESDKNYALEVGCDDYLTKPVGMETLWAILEHHLNR